MDIKIYIRTTEPWSQSLVQYLNANHIAYSKHDVSIDKEAFHEMVRKSEQKKVPVIEVGDQIVVGFDKHRLEELLGRDNQ